MTARFADASQVALDGCVDDETRWHLIHEKAQILLNCPDQAAALAVCIVREPNDNRIGHALDLLIRVLDEARMAAENGLASGPALLNAVEAALGALAAEDVLDTGNRMLLAQAYAAAGLDTPAPLQLDSAALEGVGAAPHPLEGLPDIDDLVDELLRDAGGELLQVHAHIESSLAALAGPVRAAVLAQIASDESAARTRLGLYWLLDRVAAVRAAVADVFHARARAGNLDADVAGRLVALRRWLPDDPARTSLDAAIKAAMRRELSGGAVPVSWTVHRTLACLPDGAGAQTIAAAVRKGGRRGVVMLLLKQGFGVKDAFIVPCSSATEQKKMLAQIADGTNAIDVASDFIPLALCVALGDGARVGKLPAPGLIDIAEIWDADTLAPVATDTAALVAALDADGALAALSPQARGRLVARSADWSRMNAIIATWFEDNAAVRDLVDAAQSERACIGALWQYLETRRDWWATMFARAAMALRAAKAEDPGSWMSFAATAQALANGRALKKTPIMEEILGATLAIAGMRAIGRIETFDEDDNDDEIDVVLDFGSPAPRPEKKGELAKFLKDTAITPEWMDGYLVAAAVSPVMAEPMQWLNELMDGIEFSGEPALHRYLELVMLRANAAHDNAADAAGIGARLAACDEDALRAWAGGFAAFVAANKRAWPTRMLSADDKRMLKSIAAAARRGVSRDLTLALPAWISSRHAAGRCGF